MKAVIRPMLLINQAICKANISRMQMRAGQVNALFRPHFKTHQSAEVGHWFREAGIESITVSSVEMADYFVSNGWKDITIAFPVNILEIDRINDLAGKIRLNLLIESVEVAQYLSAQLKHPAGFLIKIDTGYHRTGIDPENSSLIEAILSIEKSSNNLLFKGFLTHAGHTYHAESLKEIHHIREEAYSILNTLKSKYISQYPDLIISYGDTPSCSLPGPLPAFDEIRPGNFVYYDLMQYFLGSCTLDKIAVAVACPVVAIHEIRNEAVLYGGAVHLSKERCRNPEGEEVYGMAVKFTGNGWDIGTFLGYITSLSQEHGILSISNGAGLKPGDLVAVLPVHSCLSADLLKGHQMIL